MLAEKHVFFQEPDPLGGHDEWIKELPVFLQNSQSLKLDRIYEGYACPLRVAAAFLLESPARSNL